MSGYLQRLATRAINSRPAIHPVTNPLFAPPIPAEPADSLVEQEEMTPRADSTQKIGAPPRPPRQLIPESESPETILETRESVRAAPPKGTSDSPGATEQSNVALVPLDIEPLVQATAAPTSHPASGRFPLGGLPAAGRQYTSPTASALSVQPITRPPVRQATPVAPTSRAPQVRAPARQQREADEIQIHIGRIEVTAVSPAPAAPLPKTPRKAVNLSDYLKKGDRRVL